MAYSDFTIREAVDRFGLTVDTRHDLFADARPVEPSPVVREVIGVFESIALGIETEKSRSEHLIAPVLAEVWRQSGRRAGYYSGSTLVADPADGLTGPLDFLLTGGPQFPDPMPPVRLVVEAQNIDFHAGYGPCTAGMVAAQRLNRREGADEGAVYGCVTVGSVWRFFRLSGAALAIDRAVYSVTDLDRILGILLFMVGYNPPPPAATAA